MNKLEQAARQALEALIKANHFHDYEDEITALREALAEPAQEPVAVVDETAPGLVNWTTWKVPEEGTKLYAAQVSAKREWVDLTDDEIKKVVSEMNGNEPTAPFWRDLTRAVIAAFKEKNK